jgi:hypothetical protein
MTRRKIHIMSNEMVTPRTSDKALKGAATGALIGARFGPQGIVIGAIAGGVLGFLLEGD